MSKLLSAVAAQQVTAPTSASAIASLPASAFPAGYYRLKCWAGYVAGTPGAPEQAANGNISLYVAGLATPLAIPAALGLYGPFVFDVQMTGGDAVSIGSGVANGTALVVYDAILIADQIVPGEIVDA